MQIDSRLIDDLARMFGGAMGGAHGVRHELEAAFRRQMERALAAMDVVSRDEFEAVKAMAAKARAEQEALEARIARLEAAIEAMKSEP